jgi:hypothetical protein
MLRGSEGRTLFDRAAQAASNFSSSPMFFTVCGLLVAAWAASYVLVASDTVDRQPIKARPQRGAGDSERVDRVGLAAVAAAAPLAGHQPRRNPDDALATDQQEPRERAAHMPAVLRRPHPLGAQPARPIQHDGEPALADLDGLVAEQLAGCRRDRGDSVRALVHVRTEHHHGLRPLHLD